jgi:serine/threonine protein kinase
MMANEADGRLHAFGQYQLVRRLAVGGMAEIFLAKQLGPRGFERDVVIKRVRPELNAHGSFVEMFLDEARMAARLSHPHIVQIHDLGLIEGHYFICMEYLAGEDLEFLIQQCRKKQLEFPISVAMRLVAEAAHGLHHAHTLSDEDGAPLGLVHRDISPSNLFLTYQGNTKVLDFGIARAASACDAETAPLKGKVAYIAPEQVEGFPADARSDVYMLGLTLYKLLTGRHPFVGKTDVEILRAILRGKIPPLEEARPDVPPELPEIVRRATARLPEARYQTAAELAGELESVLVHFTTTTARLQQRALLTTLAGEERIRARTHLPSLQTLRRRGMRISGFQLAVSGSLGPPSATPTPPPLTPIPYAPAAHGEATPLGLGSPRNVRPPIWRRAVMGLAMLGVAALTLQALEAAESSSALARDQVEPRASVAVAPKAQGGAQAPGPPSSSAASTAPAAPQQVAAPALARERHPSPASTPSRAPRRSPHGRLTLHTEPSTTVFVGKRKLGKTPLQGVSLPAGRSTLRLINAAEGIDRTMEIRIPAGSTTARTLKL